MLNATLTSNPKTQFKFDGVYSLKRVAYVMEVSKTGQILMSFIDKNGLWSMSRSMSSNKKEDIFMDNPLVVLD